MSYFAPPGSSAGKSFAEMPVTPTVATMTEVLAAVKVEKFAVVSPPAKRVAEAMVTDFRPWVLASRR